MKLKSYLKMLFSRLVNKLVIQPVLKIYIRFKGSPFFLKRAIKLAKKLNAETGKRYRVFFLQNKYQVLTRDNIQRRKHEKDFDWHVNSTNMQPFCFFDTANSPLCNPQYFKL